VAELQSTMVCYDVEGLIFVINPMQLNLQTNWENHVAKIELKPYQMSKQQVKI
jgi:hypothetical protein